MECLLHSALRHGPYRAAPLRGVLRLVRGLALALPFWIATTADATVPQWFATPYDYVVLDRGIRDTLTDFGRNLGLAVSLSDAVKGRVRGRVEAETAGEFLNHITEANGLNWYFDGSVLHVSAASEYATRVITTEGVGSAAVLRQMQQLGLSDERFGIRGDGDLLSVSGPPAYVQMVRDAVRNMQPAPAVADADDPHVRVFRGRTNRDDATTPEPRS